jgi:hypothetical protein
VKRSETPGLNQACISAARETVEQRDSVNIAAKKVNSFLIDFCQNSTPVNSPLHREIQEDSQRNTGEKQPDLLPYHKGILHFKSTVGVTSL